MRQAALLYWLVSLLFLRAVDKDCTASVLPDPDSLIARSSRVKEHLTYYGVSERMWQHRDKSASVRRIVWHQASGPTKYRFERQGQDPFEVIIKNDSSFVSRVKEATDRKRDDRKKRHRFIPGHRSFQKLDLIKRNYNLVVEAGEPVAGRSTWRLEVRRRLNNELVERTLFDRETGMILARERWNHEEAPIYNLRYETVEYPARLDSHIFDTAQMRSRPRRRPPRDGREKAAVGKLARVFNRIDFPGGFEPVKSEMVERKGWPILHVSLTDGLRSLSVFARRERGKDKDRPSCQQWGGVTVRRETKGDIAYTLVGEMGQDEIDDIFPALPTKLPLPGAPGRIPRLIALIAFVLSVATLLIVFLKRLLK